MKQTNLGRRLRMPILEGTGWTIKSITANINTSRMIVYLYKDFSDKRKLEIDTNKLIKSKSITEQVRDLIIAYTNQ